MSTVQSGTSIAWHQGGIVGPKPPLKPKHIWAIRTRLQHDGRVRDFAMFNTAIESKLRGCDLVKLRVTDIHLGGSVRLRTTTIQQRTGRPVPFESTDPTWEALAAWLKTDYAQAIGFPEPKPCRRPRDNTAVRPTRR